MRVRGLVVLLALSVSCAQSTSAPSTNVSAAPSADGVVRLLPGAGESSRVVEALVINETNGGFTTTNAGAATTFALALDTAPTANVAVTVSSSDTTCGTVSPMLVTFTPANWATPQSVSVTGVVSASALPARYFSISVQTSSTDPNYDAISSTLFTASVQNINRANVQVTSSGLTTTSAGGTATFSVVLTSVPLATVVVALSSSNTSAGAISPAAMTFTTANWSTPQTATLTGVTQTYADGYATSYQATVGPIVSADAVYAALPSQTLIVSNQDNNTAAIQVSTTGGLTTSALGASTTFNVVLTCPPRASVTVPIVSSDATKGTASPSSLTFTTANWSTPQTVTINGGSVLGAYAIDFTGTTSTDPYYNGLVAPSLGVMNLDDVAYCYGARFTNAPYAGGSGTALDPYMICTAAQLQALAATPADWSKQFLLKTYVDLTGIPFPGIGNGTTLFTGVFDGNQRVIGHLQMNLPAASYVGLFGAISGATIKNLTLDVDSVVGSTYVGGLVGYAASGAITNVTVNGVGATSGDVNGAGSFVGGVVGFNGATISNTIAHVSVASNNTYIGGLAGYSYGTLTQSGATGAVTSSVAQRCVYAGGLVGYTSAQVSQSFAMGPVSTPSSGVTGGLVGWSIGSSVVDSYAIGNVTAGELGPYPANGCGIIDISSYAGGLIGVVYAGYTSRNYSTGNVNVTGFDSAGHVGLYFQAASGSIQGANDSFSTGTITDGGVPPMGYGAADSGGFVNMGNGFPAADCYLDTYRSGTTVTGDAGSIVLVDTSLPANADYFINPAKAPLTAWDFSTVWIAQSGTFPKLRWQP
jgi:hypothetical protein